MLSRFRDSTQFKFIFIFMLPFTIKLSLVALQRDWAVVIRCPAPEHITFTNGKLPVHSAVCPFPSSSASRLSQRTFASLISDRPEACGHFLFD